MPLGKNVRYRVKTNKDGSKTRLAFKGDKVVEATPVGKKGKKKKGKSKNEYSSMASDFKKQRGY